MEPKEIVKGLLDGSINIEDIIPDNMGLYIINADQVNDETVISQELMQQRLQDFKLWGHFVGVVCHINNENQIVNGMPYRSPTDYSTVSN